MGGRGRGGPGKEVEGGVFGGSAWGQPHVSTKALATFTTYCLPTMTSEDELQALRQDLARQAELIRSVLHSF